MPLPTPKPDEAQGDFVSRCMGNPVMRREYPDQKQRAAVCHSQWRKAHGQAAGTACLPARQAAPPHCGAGVPPANAQTKKAAETACLPARQAAPQTLRVPANAATFREGADIRLVEKHGEPPLFEMKAYSGGIIPGHWYWGNLALDLDGFAAPAKSIPILREHDRDRIVGHSTHVLVSDGLQVTGRVSEATQAGQEFLVLSREGHPWQASIHFVPGTVEEIKAGQTIQVNGRDLAGPGNVVRIWGLRESSVCVLGADENTSAVALKGQADILVNVISENPIMPEETIQSCLSADREPAELSVESLKTDQPAVYDAVCEQAIAQTLAEEKERLTRLTQAFPTDPAFALRMFQEGRTVEAAKAARHDALEKELAEAKRQIETVRSEPNPAPFHASDNQDLAAMSKPKTYWEAVAFVQERDQVSEHRARSVAAREFTELHDKWLAAGGGR